MSREENPKYLYTPIRENHLRKLKDCSVSLPPISRFSSGTETRSALGGEGGLQNYQRQYISLYLESLWKWNPHKIPRKKNNNAKVHTSAQNPNKKISSPWKEESHLVQDNQIEHTLIILN